jgi:hypothetical protein
MSRKRNRADIAIMFEERVCADGNTYTSTDISVNGLRLETVTDLLVSVSAEDGPLVTITLLPTSLEIKGEVEVFAFVADGAPEEESDKMFSN